MKAYAFVFPGQGAQSVGMLDAWGDHPAVREVFALAGFLPLFAIEATRDLAVHRAKGA